MKLLWLVTPLAGLLSCSSKPSCPEPQYEGKATDEAWLSVLDAEARATTDAMKAPDFTVPTPAQVFKASEPAPVFAWTSSLMATAPTRRPTGAPAWRQALDAVYSSAWAHLPPISGPVYWLRIDKPGDSCPTLSVLTTRTTWSPDAASWPVLQATGGATLTLRSLSTYLQENRVTEGPFVPPGDVTFSVSP